MTEPVAFRRAESVEEACALLAEHEDARIVSGGTALAILMRQGLVRPELLIGVRHIPRLREIEPDGTATRTTSASAASPPSRPSEVTSCPAPSQKRASPPPIVPLPIVVIFISTPFDL